jgi:hypothetical protein
LRLLRDREAGMAGLLRWKWETVRKCADLSRYACIGAKGYSVSAKRGARRRLLRRLSTPVRCGRFLPWESCGPPYKRFAVLQDVESVNQLFS